MKMKENGEKKQKEKEEKKKKGVERKERREKEVCYIFHCQQHE